MWIILLFSSLLSTAEVKDQTEEKRRLATEGPMICEHWRYSGAGARAQETQDFLNSTCDTSKQFTVSSGKILIVCCHKRS